MTERFIRIHPMHTQGTIQVDLLLLPPISWWVHILEADRIEIELHAPYERQSYMNRCEIRGPNKIQKLSFPVVKQRGQKLGQAQLDHRQKFLKQHWRSLQAAYASAPYWEEYSPFFKDLLLSRLTYLYEISWPALRFVKDALGLEMPMELVEDFTRRHNVRGGFLKGGGRGDNLTDFQQITYEQVFGSEFAPNLSVLDLLMNTGPEARQLLQQLRESIRNDL